MNETTAEKKMSVVTLDVLTDNYVSEMKLRSLSPNTVARRERSLKRFAKIIGDGSPVRLADLSSDRAKDFIAQMQARQMKYEDHPLHGNEAGPLSRLTIANQVGTLKAFGNWLNAEGFMNPFASLKSPKVPKLLIETLSDEEIAKVMSAINPATPTGARVAAMMLLFLDSGLRVGEVACAEMSNFDLDNRRLKVMGKGAKERFVPFGTKCAKALMRYIHIHRPTALKDDKLFLALDGLSLTVNAVGHIVSRLGETAGVERLHPHLLRHTFAVNYLMSGGDIETLRHILGHESLEMVKRYLHLKSAQILTRYNQQSLSPMDRMDIEMNRHFGNKRRKT